MELTQLKEEKHKLEEQFRAGISKALSEHDEPDQLDTALDQLEESQIWDPMLVEVYPVSKTRQQKDTISRLTFNLGGKKLDTLAILGKCDAGSMGSKQIVWVSNNEVMIKEEWLLEPEYNGTEVYFTLKYTFPGKLGRLKEKMISKKNVAQDVAYMVHQFRAFAEGRLDL